MKKVLLGLLIVMAIILVGGCGKEEFTRTDIISFQYDYGSYNSGYYNYSLHKENGKVIYNATGMNGVGLNINETLDPEYMNELAKLVNTYKIYKWYGFDKSDKNVLDGYSFTLEVQYSDGIVKKAHGYMKYPKNYEQGHKALMEFFATIGK